MLRAFVVVVIALSLVPARASAERWTFVLAGQSNMAGRGLPVPPQHPSRRILEPSASGLVPAKEPLGGEQGVGPGLAFARAIRRRHPQATIVLVPCAKGSTWMREWQPGGTLFKRCVAGARRTHARVAGVLFAQGESDAQDITAAARWRQGFRRFARGMRRALGDVPIVHTVLGSTTEPERFIAWSQVQRQQRPGVETSDLPLADNVHFTVSGYERLGHRLAAAWEITHHRSGARSSRSSSALGAGWRSGLATRGVTGGLGG